MEQAAIMTLADLKVNVEQPSPEGEDDVDANVNAKQVDCDKKKRKRNRRKKKTSAPTSEPCEQYPTATIAKMINDPLFLEGLELSLTQSIQVLALKDKLTEAEASRKSELISKLALVRSKLEEGRKVSNRAAWKEQVEKKLVHAAVWNRLSAAFIPQLSDGILDTLGESKENAKYSRMSITWRNAMKGTRQYFLFHEVFALMLESGGVTTPDILTFRMVSSSWRDSVDDYIQDTDKAAKQDLDLAKYPGASCPTPYHEFYGTVMALNYFINFCSQFYPGENPFISRKLVVGQVPHRLGTEVHGQFWWEVEQLLQLWGKELWRFSVSFYRTPFGLEELFKLLCAFLWRAPNLRTLGIRATEYGESGKKLMKVQKGLPKLKKAKNVIDKVYAYGREWLEAGCLPPLPHLKVLYTNHVPRDLHRVLQARYGSTLEVYLVEVCEGTWRSYVSGSHLPHLKQFCYMSQTPKEVEQRFNVNWPGLEELRFIHFNMEGESIPATFQNLNGFGKSLRKLMLLLEKNEGPRVKLEPGVIKTLSLELPLVEELTLFISRVNLNHIDFILPMVSLKELELYYTKSEKKAVGSEPKPGPSNKSEPKANNDKPGYDSASRSKKKEKGPLPGPSKSNPPASPTPKSSPAATSEPPDEIIQFSSYTNRLYESNIWSLFPELKKVTINIVSKPKGVLGMNYDKDSQTKRKAYTRDGFKEYIRLHR